MERFIPRRVILPLPTPVKTAHRTDFRVILPPPRLYFRVIPLYNHVMLPDA